VDQLEAAVAELLGIEADQELADVVGQRQMLLVLDNCEHILGPVAELVQSVLRAAPGVSVLTTSRRAIGLASEAVWGLSGLAVDPAVGFFLGRARDAGHPLAESEEGLAEVTRLCVQLDGVPLALELAAAMMRVFTPGQLLKQLGGSDRLALTGRPHGEPRHRSLEACAEWSYRLLSAAERALLCRLSAFGGAFTLEAAGAVCGGGPVSVNGAAELVGLIDHHLVEVTEDDGGRRFRLPFAVREFARRRLATSGDQPATYDRLLDHWLESRPADGDEPPTTR
jgi:predicted ATPase